MRNAGVVSRSEVYDALTACGFIQNRILSNADLELWENHRSPGVEVVLDPEADAIPWQEVTNQLLDGDARDCLEQHLNH